VLFFLSFLLTKCDDLLNSQRPNKKKPRGKNVDNFFLFFPLFVPVKISLFKWFSCAVEPGFRYRNVVLLRLTPQASANAFVRRVVL
jgi:hypothetical protein